MKVLITGSSSGIGKALALKFLKENHEVIGFDILPSTIKNKLYSHYQIDVYQDDLPKLSKINIIINNAGVQNSGHDIETNLKGAMRITEKYAFNKNIKSVLFIASASASTGSEFPEYVASKGGLVSYMKNVALRLAPFKATCNSLSPGGVITSLNDRVLNDDTKWSLIMNETPLKKWATASEIATWGYFLTVINQSMTSQDLIIDNGESAKANFIW